jgi:hypothetical protein
MQTTSRKKTTWQKQMNDHKEFKDIKSTLRIALSWYLDYEL